MTRVTPGADPAATSGVNRPCRVPVTVHLCTAFKRRRLSNARSASQSDCSTSRPQGVAGGGSGPQKGVNPMPFARAWGGGRGGTFGLLATVPPTDDQAPTHVPTPGLCLDYDLFYDLYMTYSMTYSLFAYDLFVFL